jgi:metabolite-proton symporter
MEREMEKLGGENGGGETDIRKIAFASFIGTAIEAYDLFIYGTAAALVFGALFFPEFSATVGTLLAFGTFAVSFFARPLGAVIFGHFGDRVGRKAMLVASLLLMGLATFFIGLLPTAATIGVAAPLLLVFLRFLQGVGFGGEWGGAVLIAAEHAPPEKRGFYASFPQMGPPVGFLMSSGTFFVMTAALSAEQFDSWGWRVPFLLSIVLVGIGLYIRVRIAETPAFKKVVEEGAEARVPLLDTVRDYPKQLILTAGAMIVLFGTFYLFSVFSLAYGTQELGLERSTMLWVTIVAIVFMAVSIPVFAALSDRIGRRNLCAGAAALFGMWAFPLFWLFDTANPLLITLAFSVLMVIYGMMYGPIAAFFSELFGARVRYSGISLGYNLGGILGGAFAPIIATQLFASTGASWSVSLYVLAMAAVSFVCVLLLSETYGRDIADVGTRERGPATGGRGTAAGGAGTPEL